MKAREAFAQGTDLVELRIDLLHSPLFEEIESSLSEFSSRSILTIRSRAEGGGFRGKESDRLELVRRLRELKPAYVDVELRAIEAHPDLANERSGSRTIVSWHDRAGTPSKASLRSIMAKAASYAGVVKIVATAKSALDNLRILSLYEEPGPARRAFCMGTRGLFSRVMAIELGSPITYVSLGDEQTASGQLPLNYALAVRRLTRND